MGDVHPWLTSLAGGLLIGAAAALLLLGTGRVAGISGAVGGLVEGDAGPGRWRLWFVLGLLASALLLRLGGVALPTAVPVAAPLALLGGLLVGYGTRLGNGCTSGHGVCGLGNRSTRSLVAVAVFMAVAVLTATLLHPGTTS